MESRKGLETKASVLDANVSDEGASTSPAKSTQSSSAAGAPSQTNATASQTKSKKRTASENAPGDAEKEEVSQQPAADDTSSGSGTAAAKLPRVPSKYVGVSWNRRNEKWIVQICIEGKQLYLGSYRDEDEAARKYDEYACAIGGHRRRKLNFGGDSADGARAHPLGMPIALGHTYHHSGMYYLPGMPHFGGAMAIGAAGGGGARPPNMSTMLVGAHAGAAGGAAGPPSFMFPSGGGFPHGLPQGFPQGFPECFPPGFSQGFPSGLAAVGPKLQVSPGAEGEDTDESADAAPRRAPGPGAPGDNGRKGKANRVHE